MVRSGDTLLKAAQAYRDAGAARCFAILTHLVLPGESLDRIAESKLLDGLAGTDTHPRTRDLSHPLVTVRSVAPLFVEWLNKSR